MVFCKSRIYLIFMLLSASAFPYPPSTIFDNSSNAIKILIADNIVVVLSTLLSFNTVELIASIIAYSLGTFAFNVAMSASEKLSLRLLNEFLRDQIKFFVFKIGVVLLRKVITIFIKLNTRMIANMKQRYLTNAINSLSPTPPTLSLLMICFFFIKNIIRVIKNNNTNTYHLKVP